MLRSGVRGFERAIGVVIWVRAIGLRRFLAHERFWMLPVRARHRLVWAMLLGSLGLLRMVCAWALTFHCRREDPIVKTLCVGDL